MVEVHGRHAHVADLDLVAAELVHVDGGGQIAEPDREVFRFHLPAQHLFEAATWPWGAVDVDGHFVRVRRYEEREALDVIPVRVTDEEVDGERPATEVAHQRQPERPQAGAGVEDEHVTARAHLDARRVSAIARRVGTRRGGGPARAPERDLHCVVTAVPPSTSLRRSSQRNGLTTKWSAPSARARSMSGL